VTQARLALWKATFTPALSSHFTLKFSHCNLLICSLAEKDSVEAAILSP
jgi:hypothetical protein